VTKRIYVGNLSYGTTEAALNELFSTIGEVASVSLITDNATGRSKGFAFVEMPDDAAAQQAIEQLNDREVDGRALKVAEARPRAEGTGMGRRPRRDDDRGDRGGRRERW